MAHKMVFTFDLAGKGFRLQLLVTLNTKEILSTSPMMMKASNGTFTKNASLRVLSIKI